VRGLSFSRAPPRGLAGGRFRGSGAAHAAVDAGRWVAAGGRRAALVKRIRRRTQRPAQAHGARHWPPARWGPMPGQSDTPSLHPRFMKHHSQAEEMTAVDHSRPRV
jgi:hypothetical protein